MLNKDFYDRKTIESSLNDFRGVMSATIKEDQKSITIILKDVKDGSGRVKEEFCNYVFAMMKNRGIV